MFKFRIHLVMATRPNFMKVAPLYHELCRHSWCEPILVHTGQHYDDNMYKSFLQDLNLPQPHIDLGIGSGSHAVQTGKVMIAYEAYCKTAPPDCTIVVGDVNSTAACAIAAKKLQISIVHLEAGLRSGDRRMPEEINRLITDTISDLLWTPSSDADSNLFQEGVQKDTVICIGNIMIDSFEMLRPQIEQEAIRFKKESSLTKYGIITLHRPSNVDNYDNLSCLKTEIISLSQKIPLIFPVHPRTASKLCEFNLWEDLINCSNIHLLPPQSYIAFMGKVLKSTFVITDSGGLQEETTYLGIPCFTVRKNTERPITLSQGTNRLVHPQNLRRIVEDTLHAPPPAFRCPVFWDGHSAFRAAESLEKFLHNKIS